MKKLLHVPLTILLLISSLSPQIMAQVATQTECEVWKALDVPIYRDRDGDGYGNIQEQVEGGNPCLTCAFYQGDGAGTCINDAQDCNDGDKNITPYTVYYLDADGDGYYKETWRRIDQCIGCKKGWEALYECRNTNQWRVPGQTVIQTHFLYSNWSVNETKTNWQPIALGDCNDGNPDINVNTTWYLDIDKDGYATAVQNGGCKPGTDWHYNEEVFNIFQNQYYSFKALGDCDDNNAAVFGSLRNFYVDKDGDQRGVGAPVQLCAGATLAGYVENSLGNDVDDNNSKVWSVGNLYLDADGDGRTVGHYNMQYGDLPANYSLDAKLGPDCNDSDIKLHTMGLAYIDNDMDGYAASTVTQNVCLANAGIPFYPVGFVTTVFNQGVDCDDNNKNVFEASVYYKDIDKDGFDDGSIIICAGVEIPAGYQSFTRGKDCNDLNANLNSSKTLYIDKDGDGYSSGSEIVCAGYTTPVGYIDATNGPDCDDNNKNVGKIENYYVDTDGDGYAANNTPVTLCYSKVAPTGYTSSKNLDADDNNASCYRTMSLYIDKDGDGYTDSIGLKNRCIGNSIPTGYTNYSKGVDCNDNNIDQHTDAFYKTTWYEDKDNDGFGNNLVSLVADCKPSGYIEANKTSDDCDDNNASVTPNSIWYKDADNDSYGVGDSVKSCLQPAGYRAKSVMLALKGDCRDNDASVYPGGPNQPKWYKDNDQDGFGNSTQFVEACTQPNGYIENGTDCNDANASINPNNVWYADVDGDGYGAVKTVKQCYSPGANYKTLAQLTGPQPDCNDNNAKIFPIKPTPTTTYVQGYATDGFITYLKDADGDGSVDANTYTAVYEYPNTWYPSCEYNAIGQTNLSQSIIDCDDNDPDISYSNNIWYKDADNDGYSDGTTVKTLYPFNGCKAPAGYKRKKSLISADLDCNDADASINPSSTVGLTVYFKDADGDGFGDAKLSKTWCTIPIGYVANSEDCNDANAQINPKTRWYKDADKDGYGNSAIFTDSCYKPNNYVLNKLDCNDNDATVKPTYAWYKDADGDGYSDGKINYACETPANNYKLASNLVATSGDCDDTNPAINPSLVWFKDADNDGYSDGVKLTQCLQPLNYKLSTQLSSQVVDCNDTNAAINPLTIWYKDADGDGFGDENISTVSCAAVGFVLNNTDCDDTNKEVFPGTVWYQDTDGDGFGKSNISISNCVKPAGYVLKNNDCDDNNNQLFPTTVWYKDADGDNYGSKKDSTQACTQPEGYTANKLDCNDLKANINPTTVWYKDVDGDGFGVDNVTQVSCTQPTGYSIFAGDCNDTDTTYKPTTAWYKDADGDKYSDGTVLKQCTQPANYYLLSSLISIKGDCDDLNPTLYLAIPPITVSSNQPSCASGAVTFTAYHENVPGNFSYQWKFNNVNVGTNQKTYSVSNITNNNSISCVVTLNNLCSASSNVFVQSIIPKVSISSPNTCLESSLLVLDSIESINKLEWKDENSIVSTNDPRNYVLESTPVSLSGNAFSSYNFTLDSLGNYYASTGTSILKFTPQSAVGTTVASGLNDARGIAFDKQGNMYVGEKGTNRILKYAAGSTTSTVFLEGQLAAEKVVDLAIDSKSNMYISTDYGFFQYNLSNAGIWKVFSSSRISYLALDKNDNVYICSHLDHKVYKFDPVNGTTVIAGTGTAGSGDNQFNTPKGITVDKDGNLYIADYYNNRIQQWKAGATTGTTLLSGIAATDLYFDKKGYLNVYTSDSKNLVTKYVLNKTYKPIKAGKYSVTITDKNACKASSNTITVTPLPVWYKDLDGDGYASNDSIMSCDKPANYYSLASLKGTRKDCDDNNKNVNNYANVTITSSQNGASCLVGNITFNANVAESGIFNYQWSVNGNSAGTNSSSFSTDALSNISKINCTVSSSEYCTSKSNTITQSTSSVTKISLNDSCVGDAVLKMDNVKNINKVNWEQDGKIVATSLAELARDNMPVNITYGTNETGLYRPSDFILDSEDNMYICDMYNHRIQKWLKGAVTGQTVAGGLGSSVAAAGFNKPSSLALDSLGNLFVADGGYRLQKWDAGATKGTTLSITGLAYFPLVTDMVVDNKGNLYYATVDDVSKVNLSTLTRTVLNTESGSKKLALDKNKNLYISNENLNKVDRVSFGNTTTTLFAGGNGKGQAPNQLFAPRGIAFDENDNFYVSEGNSSIKKFEKGSVNGVKYIDFQFQYYPQNIVISKSGKILTLSDETGVEDPNSYIRQYRTTVADEFKPLSKGNYTAVITNSIGCVSKSNILKIKDKSVWFKDADGDLMGAYDIDSISCSKPTGYVSNNKDCNDAVAQPGNLQTEIDVYHASIPIVSGDTTPSEADKTFIGLNCDGSNNAIKANYTIKNKGANPLTISSITVSGTDATLFTLGTYPSNIAAGDSANFEATYSPTTVGVHKAIININNNDCNESVYTFAVKGSNQATKPTLTWSQKYPDNGITCKNNYVNLVAKADDANSVAKWVYTVANEVYEQNQYNGKYLSFRASESSKYVFVATGTNGCSDSLVYNLKVSAAPVTSISVADTTICEGESITLRGIGALPYLAQWLNSSYSLNVYDSVITIKPTATDKYEFVALDATKECQSRISQTIHVIPSTPVTITATDTVLCFGEKVKLTANGTKSNLWLDNVQNGVAFTPTKTAKYTVVGTDDNACTDTASVNVIVNALPNVVAKANRTEVCADATVTLFGEGASTYVWNNGKTNGVAFVPSQEETYAVIGTDTNGCIARDSINIKTISAHPVTVTASVTPSVGMICVGSKVIFKGEGAAGLDYQWTGGSVNPIDGEPFEAIETTTYTLTATDKNGCSATTTQSLEVVPFTTSPISISVSPDTAICAGTSVKLNAIGASTFAWSNGVYNGVAFTPETTTNYVFIGTDANGCISSLNQTIAVRKAMTPQFAITPKSGIVCKGDSVMLSSIGNLNYTWSNGLVDSAYFKPTKSEVYKLISTSEFGCKDSTLAIVTVKDLPQIHAYTNNGNTKVCAGKQVTLVGDGGVAYYWSDKVKNDIPFVPTATQRYKLTGVDANGCSAKDSILITVNNSQTSTKTINTAVCTGYSFGNEYLTKGGTYTRTIQNKAGCDSIITLNLSINTNASSFSVKAFNSYTFNNVSMNSSGVYQFNLKNKNNCDSTVTLTLTITKVAGDENANGKIDNNEISGDLDNNGIIEASEIAGDNNGDGNITENEIAGDSNGNGFIDNIEIAGDKTGTGVLPKGAIAGDKNADGIIANGEFAGDANGNGFVDKDEILGDRNGNGIVDKNEIAGDKNGNGIIDSNEIAGDTNGDGFITETEIAGDINGNGIIDNNEIAGDVNGNGVIDNNETTGDKNGNGAIDFNEIVGDINGNYSIGTSEIAGDRNGNGKIDVDEIVIKYNNISITGNNQLIEIADTNTSVANNTNYGNICKNSSPIINTYTITNMSGNETFKWKTISIIGIDADLFSIDETLPNAILPNQSLDVKVKFAPNTSGNKKALFYVASTDPMQEEYYFSIAANVNRNDSTVIYDTICSGNSYLFNGTSYTKSGNYAAKLSNALGCDSIVTLQLYVKPANIFSSISGKVTKSNTIASDGKVYLYKINNLGIASLIDSSTVNLGNYTFKKIKAGEYRVQYRCGLACGVVPTYSLHTFQYQLSQPVIVEGCPSVNIQNIDIDALVLSNKSIGTGSISGNVKSGTIAKTSRIQSDLEGILVVLVTSPDNDIVDFTYTDVNGDFIFNNLANGIYKIIADIPGYGADTSSLFEIGTNQAITSSICISPDSLYIGNCESTLSIESDIVNKGISVSVYPNPNIGIFTLSNKNFVNSQYRIINNYGYEILNNTSVEEITTIDISAQPTGIYLLQLSVDNEIHTFKIIKN